MLNYLKIFPTIGYVKLLLSLFLVVVGLVEQQNHMTTIGGLLMLFTLLNKGTCPGGSCSIPQKGTDKILKNKNKELCQK